MTEVREKSLKKRFSDWTSRLDQTKSARITAFSLYSGGHWSVVRAIHNTPAGKDLVIRCRVISAGFGLLSVLDQICPYAATFSPGQPDSISPVAGTIGPENCRAWWNMMTNWKPVKVTGPRSFRELFEKDKKALHLFALSPTYLDAISDDLSNALDVLPSKSDLIIISSGKKRHGRLNDHIISTEARLQTRLGGALASLNVRLAAEIINRLISGEIRFSSVRSLVTKLSAESKPTPIFNRRRVKDGEVSQFVRYELKKQMETSYTSLLRTFRKNGQACEMKRFRDIYKRIKSQLHANFKSRS